jgi:2-haloacid dehalogenase
VRGVLLDVFETLFSPAKLQGAFASCSLDPVLVPCWLRSVMAKGFAITAAQDYRRFSALAAHDLVRLAPDRVGRKEIEAVLECLQTLDPYPDTAEGLAQLHAAGLRVLTLSSTEKSICEALLANAGLRQMVDGCLSSETVRRWKPAPEPYAYGAAQIGWPASQVAYISVHEWDVHGARRAGLQTGRVLRQPLAPETVFDAADVAGPDLPAVVELLLHCA